MRRLARLAFLALGLSSAPALAQPGQAAPTEPEQPPSAEGPAEPPAPPSEPPVASPPGEVDTQPASTPPLPRRDPPELIALYEGALEALLVGHFEAAARDFDQVAARSVHPERRAAAAELARQAKKRFGKPGGELRAIVEREAGDEESGRATFLGSTAIVGLNYGWFVPVILDIGDPKGFVGVYLLTAGASFAVPYLLTRDDDITRGMATLGGTGAIFGVGHGALLYGALAGENGFESSDDGRLALTTMLATSVAEGTLGYLYAREERLSAGHALALSSGSLWGLGFAAGGNILVAADDVDFRILMGSMLAGSAVGLVGGHYYFDSRPHLTEGDVSLVSVSGVLGAYAAAAPMVIAEVDDSRVAAGGLLGGAALGLLGGDYFVDDLDYSRGQAGVVTLGALAGGLVGAGGAFLISPDESGEEKWIVAGSAAGAIGGFLVMLKAVDAASEGTAGPVAGTTVQLTPMVGENGTTGLGLSGTF